LKKFLYFILFINIVFPQVRIGEFQSIPSFVNIQDIALSKDAILYVSNSGFIEYKNKEQSFNIISIDQGLAFNELNKIYADFNGNYWIGSNKGIQVWSANEKKLKEKFDLDIEQVSGFIDYNNLIYASAKLNGEWGLIEFKYIDDKIYYRDFYSRSDISNISNITVFNDDIYILSSKRILSGNPFNEHISYWENPMPDLSDDIIDFSSDENNLFVLTNSAIHQLFRDKSIEVFINNNSNLGSIKRISILDNNLYAISDSSIFRISKNQLTTLYQDSSLNFADIESDKDNLWLATDYGLGQFRDGAYENLLFNQPFISSPDIVEISDRSQLILANSKGVSLSGWVNYSTQALPKDISIDFNLSNIELDFGEKISKSIFHNNTLFVSLINSQSAGIFSFEISNNRLNLIKRYFSHDNQNSILSQYVINDMAIDNQDNLWATSSGKQDYPLSVFNDIQSRHFAFDSPQNSIITGGGSIAIDNYNRAWITSLNEMFMYHYSGNVMDPQNENWISQSIVPGLNRPPVTIGVSKNNILWILTEYGLIYKELRASNSEPVARTGPITTNGNITPYFSNIPFDENSIIRFDPQGNIWVTSKSNGIFVLDINREYWPNIDGINSSNSKLLSNEVKDIKFNANKGLAYISTNLGVSKFKIPFASEIKKTNQIDFFPSPYRIPSQYPLTIDGVPEKSSIQIMTLNGTIVATIDANQINGYQAFWDGLDDNGKFVGSGVYLILIISQKHKTSIIKKLAVIRS